MRVLLSLASSPVPSPEPSREARKGDHGAIAIMVALFVTVTVVLAAFVVDFGMAFTTKRQLSTAADAASLAGAAVYKEEFTGSCSASAIASQSLVRLRAEQAADQLFRANYPNGGDADGEIAEVRCKGSAIEVVYRATGRSDSPFGPAAGGGDTIETSGEAAASYDSGGGDCALCFLGSVDAGNADFSVTGGDIHVNGSITAGPNSFWDATTSISIVGTATGGQDNYEPDYSQGSIIPDPYASLALPLSEAGLPARSGSPCDQGPGIYSGNFEFPKRVCTLAPGAYVIKGRWSAKNNSVITGQGVTLYVKKPGMIDFKNGETHHLSAPVAGPPAGAPSGWPAGFVIIYDRDNTNPLSIQGNGDVTLGGAVYVPSSRVDFNGNSCLTVNQGSIVALGVVKANGQKACVVLTDSVNAGMGTPEALHLTE